MPRGGRNAWKGRWSGSGPWRARRRIALDAGESLAEGLRNLLAAMGGTPGRAGLQNLWDNWEAALGAELAALARPLGHHDGQKRREAEIPPGEGRGAVLLLGAEDAMLLQELRFRGEEILARVNGFLGQAYFSEVQVSLPLGRGEPVRTRRSEKKKTKEDVVPPAPVPSGIFLESMDRDSPVARCYARFAGRKNSTGTQVKAEEGNKGKNSE